MAKKCSAIRITKYFRNITSFQNKVVLSALGRKTGGGVYDAMALVNHGLADSMHSAVICLDAASLSFSTENLMTLTPSSFPHTP